MSIIGILSSNLFAGLSQITHNSQNAPSPFQQMKAEFQELGQDLQSGNLQAAQQTYATIQQDVQQIASQVGGYQRLHHRHAESSQTFSQQNDPVAQALSTLTQDLQARNLSGAQAALAALQNDLQQIGGFIAGGSNGASGAAATAGIGSLNVSA